MGVAVFFPIKICCRNFRADVWVIFFTIVQQLIDKSCAKNYSKYIDSIAVCIIIKNMIVLTRSFHISRI